MERVLMTAMIENHFGLRIVSKWLKGVSPSQLPVSMFFTVAGPHAALLQIALLPSQVHAEQSRGQPGRIMMHCFVNLHMIVYIIQSL